MRQSQLDRELLRELARPRSQLRRELNRRLDRPSAPRRSMKFSIKCSMELTTAHTKRKQVVASEILEVTQTSSGQEAPAVLVSAERRLLH